MAWDRNAPEFGDLAVGDNFQKHTYPFGVMINANGERFVDEGADFRNYTYAKYGRVILSQPGQFAWQIFDAKVHAPAARRVPHQARDEGRAPTRSRSWSAKLDDVDPARRLETIKAYNAAVQTDVPFNPNVKDGRGTVGLAMPKSNWANMLDTPPFEAYAVTCGITFTFGGLKIDSRRAGDRHRRRADPGPVRGRRAGRRALLLQLSRRQRADERRGVRPHRRHHGRPARGTEPVTAFVLAAPPGARPPATDHALAAGIIFGRAASGSRGASLCVSISRAKSTRLGSCNSAASCRNSAAAVA